MTADHDRTTPAVADRLAALARPQGRTARTAGDGPAGTAAGAARPAWPRTVAPDPSGPGLWAPTTTDALARAAEVGRPPLVPAPPVDGRRPRGSARWAMDARTATVVVGVVALAVGGVVLRASATPSGDAAALPDPVATATPTAGPQETVAPVPLLVHVVGAVAAPGVVELQDGARVADALAAAGGTTDGADVAALNLARLVVDGEQVRVPVVGEAVVSAPPSTGTGSAAPGPIDLNTADLATLEELPGVGPVLAGRIVEGRPYTVVEDLDDVPGIGPALMADLADRVRV